MSPAGRRKFLLLSLYRGQDSSGALVLPRLCLRNCISCVSPTFGFRKGETCVSAVPDLFLNGAKGSWA